MMDRPGTPRDIAPVVAFLQSDSSGWMRGANLPIDGGMSSARHAAPRVSKADRQRSAAAGSAAEERPAAASGVVSVELSQIFRQEHGSPLLPSSTTASGRVYVRPDRRQPTVR